MKTLTPAGFNRARGMIVAWGRPLDQARFDCRFAYGPCRNVYLALAEYQNPDGGFGNGLEPDLRTEASSAIATLTALRIARDYAIPPDQPVIGRATDWLVAHYDDTRDVWPIVPPAVDGAPHAPWWTYATTEDAFGSFLVTPTIAIAAHLRVFSRTVPPAFLARLDEVVHARLDETGVDMTMFDIQSWLDLAAVAEPPLRDRIVDALRAAVPRVVQTDPAAWATYGLTPIDVAPTASSPLASALPPGVIDAYLDHLVDTQHLDGSWPLTWSWGQLDPQTWRDVEQDWKGSRAVDILAALTEWGRIAAQ
jgi:hypothetical protein